MAVPTQLFKVGVSVIVPLFGVVPGFKPVNEGIFPVPLAANPIEGLLFDQVNVAPTGVDTNAGTLTLSPVHSSIGRTAVATGIGDTVMVAEPEIVELHPPGGLI